MITFRITLKRWAGKLSASGRAARWNSNGQFLTYSASTRTLACLENMVHRRAIGLDEIFQITLIEIPDDIKIKKITKRALPADWHMYQNYTACQQIGDNWLKQNKTAVLQVPSAIIPEEFNYLLNPAHPDFAKIKVHSIEKFTFDARLFD